MPKPNDGQLCAPWKSLKRPQPRAPSHPASRALTTNQPSPPGISPASVCFSSASSGTCRTLRHRRREEARARRLPRDRRDGAEAVLRPGDARADAAVGVADEDAALRIDSDVVEV